MKKALRKPLQSFLAESRVPEAPGPFWRDFLLVGALAISVVIEAFLRPDIVWRPFAVVMAFAMIAVLPWRRTHPLFIVAGVFLTLDVVNIASVLAKTPEGIGLYSMVGVLVIIYSLFRWGSGREATIGFGIILTTWATGSFADANNKEELIGGVVGGLILLTAFAEAGYLVRSLRAGRAQAIEKVKLLEREQLARELHDSVAHHVSAIAIQAQAGRTVADTSPEAAVKALEVIEEAASQTLAEMRLIVGNLRSQDNLAAQQRSSRQSTAIQSEGTAPLVDADLAPQPGLREIQRLSDASLTVPVDVRLNGDLDDVGPSVSSALYRIAQESVTNALRHGESTTAITVTVTGSQQNVELVVSNDGGPAQRNPTGVVGLQSEGYGLVGMAERVKLLSGQLDAGPLADGGWKVNAILPREGTTK